jgi:hypothetical protein
VSIGKRQRAPARYGHHEPSCTSSGHVSSADSAARPAAAPNRCRSPADDNPWAEFLRAEARPTTRGCAPYPRILMSMWGHEDLLRRPILCKCPTSSANGSKTCCGFSAPGLHPTGQPFQYHALCGAQARAAEPGDCSCQEGWLAEVVSLMYADSWISTLRGRESAWHIWAGRCLTERIESLRQGKVPNPSPRTPCRPGLELLQLRNDIKVANRTTRVSFVHDHI